MVQKLTFALMACITAFSVFFFDANQAHAASTMYTSPSGSPSPGALYGRALRMQYSGSANGTMLATFEQYVNGTPSFPIFRSTNAGNTWTQISNVTDQVNGWGMRWEPFLYELPQAIGNMPAGTILCAGLSIPSDYTKTKIDLYKSTDHGQTWSFVSSVATGGEAISTNGHTPIWEPFLMVANNKLIVYYSDQRDTNYGQKIVHQTSTDGVNWGSVVNDVTSPTYSDRPGMPVLARMGNGNYIMTYENCITSAGCKIKYKISSDPENFGSVTGVGLQATDGTTPESSSYVVWLPTGGANGTLVVSAYSDESLFLNTQNGEGLWTKIKSNVEIGYSRGLVPMPDGHSVFVISGGPLGKDRANSVTYGTVDLGALSSDPFASASIPNSVKINGAFDQQYGLFNLPDGIQRVRTTVAYDPNVIDYVSAEPFTEGQGLQVTVEPPSQPGQIALNVTSVSGQPISSGDLLKLHWKAKATEQLSAQITVSSIAASNQNQNVQLNDTFSAIDIYADVSTINVSGSNGATSITDNKGSLQMKANVSPANASPYVTWSVTDLYGSATDLASISPDGILTASGSGKNGTVKVMAEANDGTGIKGETVITIRNQLLPITGTPFGVGPAWSAGGEFDKAFDGHINTYYDYYTANGGYTGIDLGEGKAKAVRQIRFFPRSGFTGRMVGGKFQGSNTSTTSGFVDLYTVLSNPPLQWNTVTIANPTAFRYLRYVAPDGGYGNIAEIEFYGAAVQASSITVQGSAGSQAITEKSGTLQMIATVEPSDVGNKSVTWSVMNLDGTPTDLATISENGLLSAKNDGKVRVVAKADDGSGVQGEALITIDTEPPVTKALVSPAAPDGLNGWYVHPVTVTLSAYDNLSGVAKTEYSLDSGSTWQSYSNSVTLNQDSKYTVSYRSTDNAGNVEAGKTISFNLDATAPTITVSGLVYGSTYSDSMDITPNFTLSDNLSGVDASKTTITLSTDGARQTVQQGATIPLYTLPLGSHTFNVTSSDMAGNTGSQTVLFQTTTSILSMKALVTRFASVGWIDNEGIANSLQSQLNANDLADFVSHVKAQSGKHISSQAASYLLRDAQYLLTSQ
jgi:hypothetical protein